MTKLHITTESEPVVNLNAYEGDITLEISPNTEVTLVDTNHRANVQVDVGENATVQYIVIFSGEASQLGTRQATVHANGTMQWRTALLGGNSKHDISTVHVGDGASSDHHGIFLGKDKDRFGMDYWSEHIAKHTSGHIVVHGVLFDRSYADFKGNIKIAESGVDTDGSLTEDTLLLGDRSRSDSIPQLEIDTNQVQAAHSSAISRIDDEQLFYLSSRGIETDDAKRMIVRGFLEGIIDEFAVEHIREEVNALIEQRLLKV